MSPDWYQLATEELLKIGEAARNRQPINITELEWISRGMAGSLTTSDELVVTALSAPSGDPVISNLVHVGILGTKLGIGLNFAGEELEQLTLAGLLHDIGIFTLPPTLLSQSGRLSPQERALLEQHPIAGHDMISRLGAKYDWLALVIRQAHERWAGQGYPLRLRGRAIHEFAHVIGICDIFDALVCHRPYRRRLLPHEAISELFQNERTSFPREILKALVEQLSVYPLGTRVRLNTGESAIVVALNSRYPLRPVVQLEPGLGAMGALASAVMDLSSTPASYITDTLKAPGASPATSSVRSEPLQSKRASEEAPTTSPPKLYTDEFASLLDSLDEIASTIQEAMDSHSGSTASMPSTDEV
ncbi:hypothetical protein YTPLAS18_22900 [Nitrospira sp.]|nr:hypothetical protein YTPLAS18_22900 [Nitrospira sp.]